jgi:IMP dehydrogenase
VGATTLVSEVMTPMPLVTAPVGISPRGRAAAARQHKREKLPSSTTPAGSPG